MLKKGIKVFLVSKKKNQKSFKKSFWKKKKGKTERREATREGILPTRPEDPTKSIVALESSWASKLFGVGGDIS